MEQHHRQLDFFVLETPMTRVTQRIECLSISVDKIRKSLFASINGLGKSFISQQTELERMKTEMVELKKIVKELQGQINESSPRKSKGNHKGSDSGSSGGTRQKITCFESFQTEESVVRDG